jgi:hypothetical protein
VVALATPPDILTLAGLVAGWPLNAAFYSSREVVFCS